LVINENNDKVMVDELEKAQVLSNFEQQHFRQYWQSPVFAKDQISFNFVS
jgi:hypothetical protein